ncbi:MAG: DMT family transporter [Chlamydiia bacterium]|nr:DMT family transporter [Chlamydiia bacterium]
MTKEENHIIKSAILMLTAALAGAIVANSVKGLSFLFNTVIIYFFTRLFSSIGVFPSFFKKGTFLIKKNQFFLILLIAIFYNSSMYTYFYSLKTISVVDASLLFNSAPLYVPFFASFWLNEKITRWVWVGMIISFIGVIFVLQPGVGLFKASALWALASGVAMAASQTCNRKVAQQVSSKTIVAYLILFSTLISAVPLFFVDWRTLWSEWLHHRPLFWLGILILAGIMSWVYQLARTLAIVKVKVAQIMPLSYAGVVFAGLLGWFFFHEVPDFLSLTGTVCVIAGSIIVIRSR